MKLDPTQYTVCRLGDEGRLVAIDKENRKVLAHSLGMWGKIENVPDDKTIRGIFVRITPEGFLESVDESMQQNDITVNQLHVLDDQ